jgi:hypothetical protein
MSSQAVTDKSFTDESIERMGRLKAQIRPAKVRMAKVTVKYSRTSSADFMNLDVLTMLESEAGRLTNWKHDDGVLVGLVPVAHVGEFLAEVYLNLDYEALTKVEIQD